MDQASIEKRIDLLEKAQNEYKTKKEMLNDALAADEELISLDDKLKDAKTRYAAHKQALMNEPDNRKLQADLKDLAQDIKDTKQLLGDELVAYFMEHNSLEYQDSSGQKRRISISAKFVRSAE